MTGEATLDLDLIRLDGETQPRAAISEDVIKDYAAELERGEHLPAVDVMFDGKDYWLYDGWHRWHATRRAGETKIRAVVCRGSQTDAQWASFGANVKHGLRRTNADKERAVKLAVKHPKAATKSNAELARHCGVAVETIRRWREKLGKKNPHATGPAHCGETASKSFQDKDRENRAEDDSDDVPMGDEAEEKALDFVSRYRAKGYPDKRIRIIAKTRPADERKDILKLLDKFPEGSPAEEKAPDAEATEVAPTDAVGQEIPQPLRPDFARAEEIQHLMTQVSRIKSLTLQAYHRKDALYAALNPSSFEAECENVYRALRALKPYAVCPYCAGRGCKACLKRGWIGEFDYKAAPKEMRKHAGG